MDSFTSYPAGFRVLTLAVGGSGPTQAVVKLGALLQTLYQAVRRTLPLIECSV